MIIITKSPLTVFFLSAMLIIFMGHSNFAQTNNQELKIVSPMTLGNPDAPVKIVEYASFTCPHCATFHLDVLPNIKEKYLLNLKT